MILNPLGLAVMDWIKSVMDWMVRRQAEIPEMKHVRNTIHQRIVMCSVNIGVVLKQCKEKF